MTSAFDTHISAKITNINARTLDRSDISYTNLVLRLDGHIPSQQSLCKKLTGAWREFINFEFPPSLEDLRSDTPYLRFTTVCNRESWAHVLDIRR
jgi:hypothetical protein